jgi:hypothetical protein
VVVDKSQHSPRVSGWILQGHIVADVAKQDESGPWDRASDISGVIRLDPFVVIAEKPGELEPIAPGRQYTESAGQGWIELLTLWRASIEVLTAQNASKPAAPIDKEV